MLRIDGGDFDVFGKCRRYFGNLFELPMGVPEQGMKFDGIFRLVMQDEARHVGYGMQHFKYVLEHFPEKREVLHAHLDEAENISFAGAAATELTEAFIILAGGGLKKENIEQGIKVTTQFNLKQMQEHFERLDKCGMPERRQRSKLYLMYEMGRAAAENAGIKLN